MADTDTSAYRAGTAGMAEAFKDFAAAVRAATAPTVQFGSVMADAGRTVAAVLASGTSFSAAHAASRTADPLAAGPASTPASRSAGPRPAPRDPGWSGFDRGPAPSPVAAGTSRGFDWTPPAAGFAPTFDVTAMFRGGPGPGGAGGDAGFSGTRSAGGGGSTGGLDAGGITRAVEGVGAKLTAALDPVVLKLTELVVISSKAGGIPIPVFAAAAEGMADVAAAAQPASAGLSGFAKGVTAAVGEVAAAGARFAATLAGVARRVAEGGAALLQQPMKVLDTGISAINANVARFVQLASPAHFMRFQLAVDDLMASIGYALIPVMEQFTALTRSVGSAIFGTSAQGQKLIASLAAGAVGMTVFAAGAAAVQAALTGGIGPLLGAVAGAMGGVALASGMLTPLFDQLSSVISGLLDAGGAVVESLGQAVGGIIPLAAGYFEHLAGAGAYLAGALDRLAPAFGAVMEVGFELQKALQPLADLYLTALVEGVVLFGRVVREIAPVMVLIAQAVGSAVRMLHDLVAEVVSLFGGTLPEFNAPRGGTKDNTGAAARQVQTTDVSSVLQRMRESALSVGSGPKPELITAKNTSVASTLLADIKTFLQDLWVWTQKYFNAGEIGNAAYLAFKKVIDWLWDHMASLPADIADALKKIIPGFAALPAGNGGAGGQHIKDLKRMEDERNGRIESA